MIIGPTTFFPEASSPVSIKQIFRKFATCHRSQNRKHWHCSLSPKTNERQKFRVLGTFADLLEIFRCPIFAYNESSIRIRRGGSQRKMRHYFKIRGCIENLKHFLQRCLFYILFYSNLTG